MEVAHSVAATVGETEGNFMNLKEGSRHQYVKVLLHQAAYCRIYAAKVFQGMIQKNPGSLNFNVIALSKKRGAF
ncbi:hypothetical protein Q3G72_015596 [Acer saccharum]|nr:hypothetical protein Q3G72_015596 [Acer saccharum]